MSEEEALDIKDFTTYIPERDYKAHGRHLYGTVKGFKAIGPTADNICDSCVKYYLNLHKRGLKNNPNTPACRGHTTKIYDDIIDQLEDERSRDLLRLSSDPVAWSYSEFDFEARFYQNEVLDCSSYKKVLRQGRRSGKTTVAVVDILHKVTFNKNFKVLILTPFMSQIELIFGMIDEFLAKSKNISGAVASATKNPYRRKFYNNSYILGYAIKPGDPTAIDKIRGSDANYIYFDEVDFLDPSHIEVVMPIAMRDNCYIMATSTPKGTKTHWWRWTTIKDLGFKEFHYISAERPDWNQEKAEFFGRSSTQAKYSREYDAEFAVAELGVFRKDLVDASLQRYSLDSIKPDHTKTSIMGVDWNITTGAHIVVVAWDGKKFRLVHKTIINPDEFAQTAAVEKIIELNAYWQPQWIFVDDGAGTVQVEMLQKYGMGNKKSKLETKIVPINMSSNLEIWNPAENIKEKKYAKHFMVNNAVKYVEDGVVALPMSEDTSVTIDENDKGSAVGVGLVQQMRNFEIKRFSALGRPVYSQGYEHTLTAWMLAILGFTMKNTDFGSPRSTTIITDYSYRISEGIKRKQESDIYLINRSLEEQGPMNVPKSYVDPELNNGKHYIPVNIPDSTKKALASKARAIKEFRSNISYKRGSMRKNF